MEKKKQAVLAAATGDYLCDYGGSNKVIAAHRKMMNASGIKYVYIFPVRIFGDRTRDLWYLHDDGRFRGVFTTDGVLGYVRKTESGGYAFSAVFLHHFLQVNMEALQKIICTVNVQVFFYIHDYYSVCCEYNLLRDGRVFCGGPSSAKDSLCDGCRFQGANLRHSEEMEKTFSAVADRLTVIAPSEVPAALWKKRYPQYADRVRVIAHQKLFGEYCGNTKPLDSGEPIVIGYVGDTKILKGWENWLKAYRELDETIKAQYRFYVFGTLRQPVEGIREVRVSVVKDENAMIKALREHRADVVYLGSICPETYSYTYFEAFSANAYVLANRDGGNIAVQTRQRGNGRVFDDTAELTDILSNPGALREAVNRFRSAGIHGPEYMQENDEILSLLPVADAPSITQTQSFGNGSTALRTMVLAEYQYRKTGRRIKAALRRVTGKA